MRSVALEFQPSSVVFSKAPRANVVFNFAVSSADISTPKRSQKQAFQKKKKKKSPRNESFRKHFRVSWWMSSASVWKKEKLVSSELHRPRRFCFIFTSRRFNVSQQRGPFFKTQAASQGIRAKHLSQLKKTSKWFCWTRSSLF